jgi:hypothetical protein
MNSPEINELVVALVAAQSEFSAIPKTSDNPFFKSKYAALPEVVAIANPIITKHGLAISQFIGVDQGGRDILTTYLMHTSGQFIVQDMLLHLVPDKNGVITPQAQGAATTYARRYSYMSVLGLVADNDDDGNIASTSYPESKSTSVPTLSNKVAAAASKGDNMASENMVKMIWAVCHKGLNWDDGEMFDEIDKITGRRVEKLNELTFSEAKSVIEHLKELQGN